MKFLSAIKIRKSAIETACEQLAKALVAEGYEDVKTVENKFHEGLVRLVHAEIPLYIQVPKEGERLDLYLEGHSKRYFSIKEVFRKNGLFTNSQDKKEEFILTTLGVRLFGIEGAARLV